MTQEPQTQEELSAEEAAVPPSPDAESPPEAPEEAPESAEPAAAQQLEDDLTIAQRAVAELTGDLQRLQAEFVNYKRRVDRDRELIRQNATYVALTPIIDVLDAVDRAREHNELEGGFKAVAEQLERAVVGLGLTRFGAPGDPFDPTIHEALSHIGEDPEVAVTTCKVIAKAGYRMGERVVRAAQVLVVDPPSGPTAQESNPVNRTQ
ncbi:nucleotide exchange factor GrpE [Nocardioides sp.]|uniref:nucleotide exchange factor GrpE n=1 Tax=Nocardioides sp. TaxID=35761 RepID=UPI0026265863|nr:nucleotide exchange factor GrpE [Nocardioides sp.]MDI6908775.1 nucleotide exchange factor GrpE [Nocardioides sp.]